MRTFLQTIALVAALGCLAGRAHAQTQLQDSLRDSVGAHWIYDDFAKATAEARSTGKPMLALFR